MVETQTSKQIICKPGLPLKSDITLASQNKTPCIFTEQSPRPGTVAVFHTNDDECYINRNYRLSRFHYSFLFPKDSYSNITILPVVPLSLSSKKCAIPSAWLFSVLIKSDKKKKEKKKKQDELELPLLSSSIVNSVCNVAILHTI